MLNWFKTLPLFLVGAVAGCSQTPVQSSVGDYLQQSPANSFSDTATSERLVPFLRMFHHLSIEEVEHNIDDVYADQLYFDDTFHRFNTKNQIKQYFLNLAGKSETLITPLDYMEANDHVLLRWKMNTKFTVMWKNIDITTTGITHLHFNKEGLIDMHQDYWDGIEGFYGQLPFLGAVLKNIRSSIGDASP